MISLVVLTLFVFLIVGIVFFLCARAFSKKYNISFLLLFFAFCTGGLLLLCTGLLMAYWFLIANQPSTNDKLPPWANSFPEIKGGFSYGLRDVDVTCVLVKRKDVNNQQLADKVLKILIEQSKKKHAESTEALKIYDRSDITPERREAFIEEMANPPVRKSRLILESSLAGSDPAFSFHVPLKKFKIYEQEYRDNPCVLLDTESFSCH